MRKSAGVVVCSRNQRRGDVPYLHAGLVWILVVEIHHLHTSTATAGCAT